MTVKSLILLQNTDFGAGLPQGCRNHSQNHALLCRVCRSTRASGGDIWTNTLVFQVPHQRAVLIYQVLSLLVMALHLEGNTYRATKSGPE